MANHKKRYIVITGAAGGIGKALLFRFAREGYHVIGLDINTELIEVTKKAILKRNLSAELIKVDITNLEEIKNILPSKMQSEGELVGLMNNAGINHIEPFSNESIPHLHKIMDVNFYGAVNTALVCMPYLLKSKGSIINVSTIAGFAPLYHRTSYCASKYALHGFMEALRTEYIGRLHIGIALPTYVQSKFGGAYNAKQGIKNLLTPEFVAEEIYKAFKNRKEWILIGKKAKLAHTVYRLFPKFFIKKMLKEQNAAQNPSNVFNLHAELQTI